MSETQIISAVLYFGAGAGLLYAGYRWLRYRSLGSYRRSSRDSTHAIQSRYPAGRQIEAHFDPGKPARAHLERLLTPLRSGLGATLLSGVLGTSLRSRDLKRRFRSGWDPVRRAVLSRFARRKVFIDCGGMTGQSVRKFRHEIDPKERFTVHTFEPNPQFEPCYRGMRNHTLHREGIWISDGEMSFYLDRHNGDGSTLLQSKRTGQLDFADPVRIRTINLSSWLTESFTKRDYIILKLDIEGAEFEVLEKMLQEGTLGHIDELFIEWHWDKVDVPKERMKSLKKRIRVPIRTWNALKH